MTIEQVFQMLDSAMRSEVELMEEFVQARKLLRAAEAQTRLTALEAFRHSLQVNLALEEGREQE